MDVPTCAFQPQAGQLRHPPAIAHSDRFASIFVGGARSHQAQGQIIFVRRRDVERSPASDRISPLERKLFKWGPTPRAEDFSFIDPWQRAQRVIASWKILEDDWDDQGAAAPTSEVIRDLQTLLSRARSSGVPAPSPFITGDPELGLSWTAGGTVATASFLADGRFLAYCPQPDGKSVRIDGEFREADIRGFLAAVSRLF